jgi:hypothetical protein
LSIPDANVIMDDEKFLLSVLVALSNLDTVAIGDVVDAKALYILNGI